MKYILYVLILIGIFMSQVSAYNLDLLDWNNSGIKKNWCLANTKRLFGMISVNMGPDAATSLKFANKFDMNLAEIGDVLVIGRNNSSIGGASTPYGHIGVIKEITDSYFIMSDGNRAYPNLKILKSKLKNDKWGIITPDKMIELGATKIKMEDLIDFNEILSMAKEYINMERVAIFSASEQDYGTGATKGDVKDLIEIAFYRFMKNGTFPAKELK